MFRSVMPARCRVGAAVGAVSVSLMLSAGVFGQAGSPTTTPASTPDAGQTSPTEAAPAQAPSAAVAPVGSPQSPVAISRSRRRNSNRQARIARNIQDSYSHRYEVAGGGGYLRFRTGQYLQKSNEIDFFMSGTRQWSPRWGLVADVRGNYGTAKIPNLFSKNNVFRPNISEYNFTAGAQYRFIGTEKYSVAVVATGGVSLSKFGGDAKGLRSQDLGMWKDSNANPTFTVGVNFDYNVYNNVALRVQPTYVGTTFGSTLQNNLGVNGGIVYRFGRQ